MSTLEFNSNFDLLTKALRSFAYSLTKNDEDAKDLYQETAFRAMTNRDNFYINSGSNAVSNAAGSNIMMKELNKMVASLDDSIKKPFLMHFDGFKYQEIADELALPLGTVKSRIFFARKALKKMVVGYYGSVNLARA